MNHRIIKAVLKEVRCFFAALQSVYARLDLPGKPPCL